MIVASLLLLHPAFAAEITRYHYKGPSTVCFCETAAVVEEIRKSPDATHTVWVEGWNSWKSWKDVPELVKAVGAGASSGASGTWSYAGADGQIVQLDTDAIAARVSADPSGVHRVWKSGMGGWATAMEMPEIAAKVTTTEAPPPLPEAAPPPLPESTSSEPPRFVAPDRTAEPPRPDPGVRKEDAPVALPGPINATPSMHLGPPVRFGGDFLVDLLFGWTCPIDADCEPATPTVRLNWARPHIDVDPAPWFTARAGVYLAQTPIEDEVILEGEAVSLAADEVWAEAHSASGSLRHRVRIGVQAPILGQVDSYEERVPLGGTRLWKSVAERADMVPYRDAGLTYGLSGKIWSVEVQAANGGSGLDTNTGKDFSGRLTIHGGDYVTVSGSGLYGARAANSAASMVEGALVIDAHYSIVHANIEGVVGRSTENNEELFPGAFGVAAGVGIPLKAGPATLVDITGVLQVVDPSFGDTLGLYDRWWTVGGVLDAHWRIAPGSDFRTGLVFESYTPESEALPVETELTLQAGWSF